MHLPPLFGQPQASPASSGRSGTANRLEAAFLAEMLKHAAPQGLEGAFGGGVGEAQFASFLTEQHAEALAQRLDLGLLEKMDLADA